MPADIAVRPIAWVGLTIAAVVASVVAGVFLLLRLWGTAPGATRVDLPARLERPEPALQSAPQLDLARYRAEKERLLRTAAWVDADRGIARIPIADAMALLAARPASAPEAAR